MSLHQSQTAMTTGGLEIYITEKCCVLKPGLWTVHEEKSREIQQVVVGHGERGWVSHHDQHSVITYAYMHALQFLSQSLDSIKRVVPPVVRGQAQSHKQDIHFHWSSVFRNQNYIHKETEQIKSMVDPCQHSNEPLGCMDFCL